MACCWRAWPSKTSQNCSMRICVVSPILAPSGRFSHVAYGLSTHWSRRAWARWHNRSGGRCSRAGRRRGREALREQREHINLQKRRFREQRRQFVVVLLEIIQHVGAGRVFEHKEIGHGAGWNLRGPFERDRVKVLVF